MDGIIAKQKQKTQLHGILGLKYRSLPASSKDLLDTWTSSGEEGLPNEENTWKIMKILSKKRPSTPRAVETSCGVEWKTKWTTHTGELIQWTPSVSPNTWELQHFLASSMTNQDDVGTCVEIQFVEATGEIHEDRRTVTCGATLVVRLMRKVFWVQKQNRGSTEFYENGGRIIMFPVSTCFCFPLMM